MHLIKKIFQSGKTPRTSAKCKLNFAGGGNMVYLSAMKNKVFLTSILALTAFAALAGDASVAAETPQEVPLAHKMTLLALQIGLILFAAKLGGMLASLFRLPSVLGELASGIAIGPYALGGIGLGSGLFAHGLIPAAHGSMPITPELYGLCTIASVILLFMSGLETNLKMFLKLAFAGSLVGIGGVVASFLLGNLCTVYLLPKFLPDSFGYLAKLSTVQAILDPAALFMGIMSTATSVGITARILSERRKMDSEEGVTIMAGAVIDDVLGIIVLAVGMGIIKASEAGGADGRASVKWLEIGKVALNAFGLWLGGTALGIVFARKISWLLKLFKSPVAIGTLAFGLSLVIAGLFEAFGLTLIIGAYVMGLSLSRTDIKYMIQENLEPVYTFFVPVFFCVMGMMVDCSALCSKPVLMFGAIYTLLAVVAKIAGCAIPSLFCGFNVKGALRIGAGMIPRGEVALIIAGIGVSTMYNGKPILTQEVFGIGIMMTLVTTIVAPPCLVGLFNLRGYGVKHRKVSMDGSRAVTFTLQSELMADLMLDKLIKVFRQDGFFTHLYNARENIWAISMDDIEISIRKEDSNICCECTPAEENLVVNAWMEVVSEINTLAKTLSRPIRKSEIEKLIPKADEKANSDSIASRFLRGFVMIPNFKAHSKKEALEKLIDIVAKECPKNVLDAELCKKAVFEREESMPTGLDHGIAVPHGRTTGVNHVIGAVALVDNSENDNGIIPDYETIDHSRIQIIVLTLVPAEGQTPYLQLMAFISRVMRSEESQKKLLDCKSEEEMRKFFKYLQ